MDVETLIVFLIVAAWALSQLFSGKKRPAGTPPRPGRERSSDVDEALREIREALSTPGPSRTEPDPAEPRTKAHDVPPIGEEETPFEALPAFEERFETALDRHVADTRPSEDTEREAVLEEGLEVERVAAVIAPSGAPHDVLRRLRTPEALREAVLLRDILGPPRARQLP